MKPLRVLSLFDGISCGQVALERAGIPVEIYYASEIDKYAIQITQKNYPNTIQLGDVTKIDFTQFEGKIDLLIGGSPCQSLSITNSLHREHLDGKSKLFFEYVRALREVKPKYFFFENVESMTDECKYVISRELGCKPQLIDSVLLSAQKRPRYYWFNFGIEDKNLLGESSYSVPYPEDKGILLKDILASGLSYQEKSDCLTARYQGATFPHDYFRNQRTQVAEPVIYQLPRGYNDGGIKKDKSPALTTSQWQYNNLLVDIVDKNNGEVPKMFSLYNKQIVEDKSPTVTANSNVSLTNCGSVGIFSPIRLSEYEKSQGQAQRVYSVRGKSVALNANGGGQGGKTGLYKIDLPDGDYIIRKLTPLECERLQTLPDEYTQSGMSYYYYNIYDIINMVIKGEQLCKNVKLNDVKILSQTEKQGYAINIIYDISDMEQQNLQEILLNEKKNVLLMDVITSNKQERDIVLNTIKDLKEQEQ